MRILKDPDIRRAEILDVSQQLFVTKGYSQTTIIDILSAAGIAKGTFYYYFKSKEEVMDAVIARIAAAAAAQAQAIAQQPDLSPPEKIKQILMMQQPRRREAKEQLLQQFHHTGNAEMHQKSLVAGIRTLSPILADVVEEGISQGVFQTPYPQQSIEILLTAGQVLFDDGLFQLAPEEAQAKTLAFIHTMCVVLGAANGTFDFMAQIL